MNEIYLSHLSSALGSQPQSVEDAARNGQLFSETQALLDAGFRQHFVCRPGEDSYSLAARALRDSGVNTGSIDAIIYSSCLPMNGDLDAIDRFRTDRDVKTLMRFPASRLQAEFGMSQATLVGINQQACTGMLGALRIGRALMHSEPELRSVLCITADRFPEGAIYEQAYNLISDGAAACLLGREPEGFRLLDVHHIANGGLLEADNDQTAGSFFSYTCRLVDETLARAGLTIKDLRWLVPQNIHRTALQVLGRLLDTTRLFCPSVASTGHIISADNIRNLAELQASGELAKGDRVLTFMAGFGSHWQSALLEVA